MKATQSDSSWQASKKQDLQEITKKLKPLGFIIDEHQPHMSGERFLMTKDKLVLAGEHSKNKERVIIKASKHPLGRKEIEIEKQSRDLLKSLSFTKKNIVFPAEIYYGEHDGSLIWVTSYVSQDKVFVAHTLEDQFFLTLRAFEAQEAFHATTFEHLRTIKNTFPVFNADENIAKFDSFIKNIAKNFHDKDLLETMTRAEKFLKSSKTTINRYSNFLVHQDFVPHNFRIKNNEVYMLDCSAVYFSNKYEGWARFLNYMLIHNPSLEKLLSTYIMENRGEDEYLSLRLMRVLKIGELLEYYTRALGKTAGDLHELTQVRIEFWHKAMQSILDDTPITENVRNEYIIKRDALRSPEEKERQKEFALS